ncbi:hypothetical protein HYW20_01545 [Candidatus Woesearchaeota archaeon]|nr:hypothetical protein [Candidatus Woesearchaeota archaeon]
MFSDIVIPNNNEAEFVEVASKISIKKLYFLYEFGSSQKEILEKIQSLKHKKIDIETGLIVNQKNINMAMHHSKLLVARSSDNDRFLIESKKIKLIYGFEESPRKDYLHQRASGLNHILCELARKNNIAVGFSYSSILNKKPETASLIMGRMMQNIALCRKYKTKTIIASFSGNPFELRAPHDIASLFAMLGMDGKKINESLMFNL